jgi:hypothetical protein
MTHQKRVIPKELVSNSNNPMGGGGREKKKEGKVKVSKAANVGQDGGVLMNNRKLEEHRKIGNLHREHTHTPDKSSHK